MCMGRTDILLTSDGKIDSNRFTLPNRNEKNSIQYHSSNALAIRASLCCKISSLLTFASMSPLASAMRAGRSWLRWTQGLVLQQLPDQSAEPLVWTVEGILTDQ